MVGFLGPESLNIGCLDPLGIYTYIHMHINIYIKGNSDRYIHTWKESSMVVWMDGWREMDRDAS